MVIVEWFSESGGYDQCIASNMVAANMVKFALMSSYPRLTVCFRQIGNGCTGTKLG
jgi:hypothetical protein